MVTEIMQYFDPAYSVATVDAEVLYAGIAMDTKNFTFKTGVRTFEAAAYLRSAGVDTIHVKKMFRESVHNYKLKASIVTEAQLYNNIAISLFDGVVPHVVIAGAADEMLEITDVKASFVVASSEEGKVVISGRSLGELNVQVILEKLGGGGHLMVAGAQIAGKTVEEVGVLLKQALDEAI
jgi:c-di-AMP phosphodiesterase-like protein